MRKYLYLFALTLIAANTCSAQTWKWGKRGGGMLDNGTATPKETVIDMATDNNGNVYILAIGINGGVGLPDVDGHAVTTYGDRDMIIAKFNCNGDYKWSKAIGGASVDFPTAIGTDTLGHVYVCGKTFDDLPPYNVHFGSDTTQLPGNEKSIFLIQYDTLGNFKWLRQPNPDTATHINTYTCESYDMKVLPNGDVYWLVKLHNGLVSGGNGWVTTGRHPYILQYNAAGNLVTHADLQMETDVAAFYGMKLERTNSGKFIIAGGQDYYPGISNFTMGGQLIAHSMFVGMFSATGQFLWEKENTIAAANSVFSCRPIADSSGIYLAGIISNFDVFNTFTHHNTLRPTIQFTSDPFLCKLDSVGGLIWMKSASGVAANYTASVAMKNANELYLSGDYTSVWWDNNVHVDGGYNNGTHLYVARFNSQGTILGIDSLKSDLGPNYNNFLSCSVADKNNGVLIGGNFAINLHVAGQTLTTHGGFSDFFFARFGYNCNCTAPVSLFTLAITGTTVNLAYTGTLAGADSVVWNYGNGVTTKLTGSAISLPFSYTYPQGGTYNLCATVYNNCGSHQYCTTIALFGTGITTFAGMENIRLYPNPANDHVVIEGVAHGTVGRLFNMLGQDMVGTIEVGDKQIVSLTEIPTGMYILVLTNNDDSKRTALLVKQ